MPANPAPAPKPAKKPKNSTPYALRAKPYPRAVKGRFPACSFCESLKVVKAGLSSTKKQVYRCKECSRRSYGYITLKGRPPGPWAKLEAVRPTRFRCPYCNGRCWKRGLAPNGSPKYKCKDCGRENTGLIARPRKPTDGPFPHKMTFHLNPQAWDGLRRLCARNNETLSGAIRRLLRDAATGSVVPMALCHAHTTEDGRRLYRLEKPARPRRPAALPVPLSAKLPSELRQVQRYRLQNATIYRPCFMNVAVVTVHLDDLALSGLLKAAQVYKLTRLSALRFLLTRARYDR